MQYDRFLDVHLVTSRPQDLTQYANDPDKLAAKKAAQKLGPYRQGAYQYDFHRDVLGQQSAYSKKLQQTFRGQAGGGGVTIVRSAHITHVLGNNPAPASAGTPLNRFQNHQYISCFVNVETLKPARPRIEEFAELLAWVSEGGARGKMRLNCHGSDAADAGFAMGRSSLSPAELVDALVRHGFTKRDAGVVTLNEVGHETHWKPDAEAAACEKCRVKFSFLTRRHHCRRCGGIFCDACTKKRRTLRNPLTEIGRTPGTISDCRVCDACAAAAERFMMKTPGIKADVGLTQITLALCLSARTEAEFADMKTGFARNSIAVRFMKALSQKGLHGIQVSGSNEVVKWSDDGLLNSFGIAYPGMPKKMKPAEVDDFADTDWAGLVVTRNALKIPASILGSVQGTLLNDPRYARIRGMKIVPIHGGTKMAFGSFEKQDSAGVAGLVREAFRAWTFTSWRIEDRPLSAFQELAHDASDQSRARKFADSTICIDAPQRHVTITRDANRDFLVVSGFEERRFKDYKVFVST